MRPSCALLVLAVLGGAPAAVAQPAPEQLRVAVGVDLGGLPDATAERIDALGLETRVVQRLLQEGFAVVAPFAQPHVLLRAEVHPGGVKLVAVAGTSEESVTVSLTSGTRAELQLEIAQKLVDLARARAHAVARELTLAAAAAPPQPEAPAAPALRPVIIPQVPPPPKRTEVGLQLGIGADALWRGRVDPLLRLGGAVHGEGRWSLGFAGGFSPSSAEGLTTQQWQLGAGPRFLLVEGDLLRAHASLLGGVVAHAWRFSGVQALEPEGLALDGFVSAPVEVDFPLQSWLLIGVRLAPGLGWPREHARDQATVWRTEAARLEAGATVAIRL